MAGMRFRKQIAYPEEDHDLDITEVVQDEEEQERVIEQLEREDAKSTAVFRKICLAVPAIASLYYLRLLLGFTSFSSHPLLHTANIASLCLSVTTALQGAIVKSRLSDEALENLPESASSPRFLIQHAAGVNALLCAVLVIAAYCEDYFGRATNLRALDLVVPPSLTLAVLHVLQWLSHPISVEQLKQLRYEYKGA